MKGLTHIGCLGLYNVKPGNYYIIYLLYILTPEDNLLFADLYAPKGKGVYRQNTNILLPYKAL